MRNKQKGTVKINIYRFKKIFSLYQRGMRPYVFSRKSKSGWKAGGKNINYHLQRKIQQYDEESTDSYVLSFNYEFQYDEDETFFAACIPYSYTYLLKQLSSYQLMMNKNSQEKIKYEITTLSKSMCGSQIPLVTIQSAQNDKKDEKQKQFIIINCRTHPGQSSSSWVMEGIIKQLCTNKGIMKWLSDTKICFKLVPMLNPDGVFIGNYRTGIMGDDFNRKFLSGKKQFFPQIHGLRKLVNECKKNGMVSLFLDLHGHSVLKNSFIFGPLDSLFQQNKFKLLPHYLKHSSKYFKISSCRFKPDNKIQTARIYFQKQHNIMAMTIQNSLGLYSQNKQNIQILTHDWIHFGSSIILSFQKINTNLNLKIYQSTLFKSVTKNTETIDKKIEEIKSKRSSNLLRNVTQTQYEQKTESNSKFLAGNSIKLKPIETISKEKKQQNKFQKFIKLQEHSKQLERNISPYYQSKGKFWKGSEILQRLPTELKQKILYNIDHRPVKEIPKIQNGISVFNLTKQKDQQAKSGTIQQKNQVNNENYLMQVVLQNLSQNYDESINDSDNSSESLAANEKKYLQEQIRRAKDNKILDMDDDQHSDKQLIKVEQEDKIDHRQLNINRFRQYRFKLLDFQKTQPKSNNLNTLKQTKRDPKRFKQLNNKSLRQRQKSSKAQESSNIINITKKKRFTQRILEKISILD